MHAASPAVSPLLARAHLHYCDDTQPGIRRVKSWGRCIYLDHNGKKIRDAETLRRIRLLAVPPAYTDVWICPNEHGHIQATGKDARGRKQYRYHADWNALRNAQKFHRMVEFGYALPRIRRTVHAHLALPKLSMKKVCAAVVALIDRTHIRVGNDEYAKENHSFGLTTFRDQHVLLLGDAITFRFRGKSGIQHATTLHDPVLSKIIHSCQEIPGHELFTYLDERGECHDIKSTHINEYLQGISECDYTAKDFRTWHGTTFAMALLRKQGPVSTFREAKRNVSMVVKEVAKSLGNTPAVCRKSYIHPAVIDVYVKEWSLDAPHERGSASGVIAGLRVDECATLRFLEKEK